MRARIAAAHPSQEFTIAPVINNLSITIIRLDPPIVNDKVREHKLMRVEQEGRDAKSNNRNPEVDEVGRPE